MSITEKQLADSLAEAVGFLAHTATRMATVMRDTSLSGNYANHAHRTFYAACYVWRTFQRAWNTRNGEHEAHDRLTSNAVELRKQIADEIALSEKRSKAGKGFNEAAFAVYRRLDDAGKAHVEEHYRRRFPVMFVRDRYPDAPGFIPWDVIEHHDACAQSNHSQTLERLAERGGLSPVECLAVMTNQKVYELIRAEPTDADVCRKLRDAIARQSAHRSEKWLRFDEVTEPGEYWIRLPADSDHIREDGAHFFTISVRKAERRWRGQLTGIEGEIVYIDGDEQRTLVEPWLYLGPLTPPVVPLPTDSDHD